MTIRIESTSFREGERIPETYAFAVPDGDGKAKPEGGNVSPHLRWQGEPDGTRSFALVCVDHDVPAEMERMNSDDEAIEPEAPRQTFSHWLVADIPAGVHEVPEGAGSSGIVRGGKPTGETSFGGLAGANGYTEFLADDEEMAGTYGNYDGPFPPWNDEREHRYRFRVYALDVPRLDLPGDFTLAQLQEALSGHVLDEGELAGTYSLNRDGAG